MLTWTWVLTCKCVAAWVPQQKMCGVGDDSLYARQPTKQGVGSITREDLIG